MVDHRVDHPHLLGLGGVVVSAEEEYLSRLLLADLVGQVGRTEAAVEGGDVGVGLFEDGVFARGEREVTDDVEGVAAADGPAGNDGDDGLRHDLADYVGTDLQRAASEIEKLMTFAGERTRLTADDVLAASGQTREFNVFELQNAIGEGRHADAARIAERILQQASNPQSEAVMMVAVLNGYFDKLWKLQVPEAQRENKYDIASRIGVPPFFADEYRQAAQRYTRTALADAYSALLAADYELKGGSARDPSLILTLLLRRLLPPQARPAHTR